MFIMRTCEICQKQVNVKFKKCPFCGHKSYTPFYKNIIFIWAMVIIFPPIGVVLLCLYTNYPKEGKIITSAIMMCMFFAIVFSPKTNTKVQNSNIPSSNVITENITTITSIPNSTRSTPTPLPTNTPEPTKSPRKEKIDAQFSWWDGSHDNLTKYIKKHMNNPKSYEHVETLFSDKGDYIYIVTKFRGTNSFGGIVTNTVSAKADIEGNLLEVSSID